MSSLALVNPHVVLESDPDDELRQVFNPVTGRAIWVDGSIADNEIDWNLEEREARIEEEELRIAYHPAPSETVDLISALISGSVFITEEPAIEAKVENITDDISEPDTPTVSDVKKSENDNNVSDGFDKRYWKIKTPFCIYDLTKNIPLAHSHLNQFYAISKKHRIKNQEDEDPKKKDNLYKRWLRNTSNNADGIDFRPDLKPYSIFIEHDDKTGLDNRIFNIFSGFMKADPKVRIPLNSATHSEGKLPPEHHMLVADRDCTQLAGLAQASACASLVLEARIDFPESAMRIA